MCTITLSAYTLGCPSSSGIEELYIIDKRARESTEVAISVTNGAAAITGTGGTAYLWKPMQESFFFTQPKTKEITANTLSYLQTLEGSLDGYSAATVYLNEQLDIGVFEAAIKMKNGTYIYAGLDANGLRIAGGDGGKTGQGVNDAKGSDINMTCQSTKLAPTFSFTEFNDAFTITIA